jgi:hypothetical protein
MRRIVLGTDCLNIGYGRSCSEPNESEDFLGYGGWNEDHGFWNPPFKDKTAIDRGFQAINKKNRPYNWRVKEKS